MGGVGGECTTEQKIITGVKLDQRDSNCRF